MAAVPQRRHDPGRTLAQMVLALADGATCLSDLAAMRSQRSMFGAVASEATVWRTFDQIGSVELRGIAAAVGLNLYYRKSVRVDPCTERRPGVIQIAMQYTMTNLMDGGTTVMKVLKVAINVEIDPGLFTEAGLSK